MEDENYINVKDLRIKIPKDKEIIQSPMERLYNLIIMFITYLFIPLFKIRIP